MVILLGGSGYVGSAFRSYLEHNGWRYASVSRRDVDYYDARNLASLLRQTSATLLINAAGYTGKPNVDACETDRTACLMANAVLPGIVREACEAASVPWGHVSSGCIYTGRRVDGGGFMEDDSPNFCFRTNNCSFYSGTKALGEECLAGAENVFIWRLRMPFNESNSKRNYLSKLLSYEQLLDVRNSLSQIDEFVHACCESWRRRIPFGIYHVTNTGSITTREITRILKTRLPTKRFDFFANESEFMRLSAATPRSSCVLDNSKLLATGIKMSHVEDAIRQCIARWAESPQSRQRLVV